MAATPILSAAFSSLANAPTHVALSTISAAAGASQPIQVLPFGLAVAGITALLVNPRDRLVRLVSFILINSAVVVTVNPLYERGSLLAAAIEVCADGLGTVLFVRFCLVFSERHRPPLPTVLWIMRLSHAGLLLPLVTSAAYVVGLLAGGWPFVVGQIGFCLGLMFGVLLGLAVLGRTFLHRPTPDVRGPILVVWLGCAITFLPMVSLNVLPALFFRPAPISFNQTAYGLVALPLAVAFASIRWRKVSLLALIDRVSVYMVLGLLLLGCYVALAVVATRLEGVPLDSTSGLLPLALAIIAATTFDPLRSRIQRFVDTALYRDHFNLGSTVERFSRSLANVRDRGSVAQSLASDVSETLNLSGAALVFLPGGLDAAVLRLLEPDDLYAARDFVKHAARDALVDHLANLDLAALAFSSRQPLAHEPWPGCEALVVIGPGGGEDVTALLIVGSKRGGGHLRGDDQALLATIAHQAATALENAALVDGLRSTLSQLRQSTTQLEAARAEQQLLLRELVEAEERERAALARDLHDDALQDLMYLSRHSRYCAGLLAALPDGDSGAPVATKRLREELDQLSQAASISERKLRDLCVGLYPALLESLGLPAALESLAEDLSGGMSVQVNCEPAVERLAALLDADTRLHVYRIAQEALRNASRHAHAQRVEIHLSTKLPIRRASAAPVTRARLVLTISDDGVGVPHPIDYVALLRGGHLGLASMRERAERIRAELKLAPKPPQGTQITLVIPLPDVPAWLQDDATRPSLSRRDTPGLSHGITRTQPPNIGQPAHHALEAMPQVGSHTPALLWEGHGNSRE
jgi:signal transduction histidine kinase